MASRFGAERVDILNTLVTMLPGTSVTYYGEEIGMKDSCAKFGPNHNESAVKCVDPSTETRIDVWARSPMQWDATKNAGFSPHDDVWIPVAENHKTVNVKVQEESDNSHLKIYKELLALRRNKAIMESDNFDIKALNTSSFAFQR